MYGMAGVTGQDGGRPRSRRRDTDQSNEDKETKKRGLSERIIEYVRRRLNPQTRDCGDIFINLAVSAMDRCVYEEVGEKINEKCAELDVDAGNDGQSEAKLLFRQVLVVSCIWVSYLQMGLGTGAPTVLIPQLRQTNITVNDDLASWISSIGSFSGVLFSVVTACAAHYLGMRRSYQLVCITTAASFIVLYCSSTVSQILVAEFLQGPLNGATMTISLLIVVECVSPKYRGIFLTIKSATYFCSIWLANAIGAYFYWKNIAIVGIALSFYNTAFTFAWPESPYWLASKGKFTECRKAHRWLKGTSLNAEKELQCLISSQIERDQTLNGKTRDAPKLLPILKEMKAKEFYRPILVCFLLSMSYEFTAKMVLCVYAIDIIKKITGSVSAAYAGMLILDGISVFGMYVGSIASRYLKRRTLLLSAISTGAVFLFLMSLYMYLIKLDMIMENAYVSIFFLLMLSLGASCGPMILASSLITELIPLKLRTLATVICCSFSNAGSATFIKLAPLIFSTFQMHGGFFFFAIGTVVCIILLVKYLPETKDKTLEEIESYFKGVKLAEGKELVPIINRVDIA